MGDSNYPVSGAEQYDAHEMTVSHAETAQRAEFIRSVYGLLSLSVLAAIAAAWLAATTDLKIWVMENWILMLVLYIGSIIGCYVLRKTTPVNMLLMLTFTSITGLWIGPVAYVFPGPALNAGVTTAIIFVSLSVYTHISKRDFSFMRGFLTMGLVGVLVMLLLDMFIFHSDALAFGISVAGVLVFSGFILYDTSNIMKRYPPDEYIAATLDLYLDILNLFWFLLRIFIELAGDQ